MRSASARQSELRAKAWVADLADAGLFGAKGSKTFARSADWRTEADRLLQHVKKN